MKLSFGMIAVNFLMGIISAVLCFFAGLGMETLIGGSGSILINIVAFLIPFAIIIPLNIFMIKKRKKKMKRMSKDEERKIWIAHAIAAIIGIALPIIAVAAVLD